MIMAAIGPKARSELHLIRDDAEASLCGIPRATLTTDGIFNEPVCEDCLEWLPKRVALSANYPKAKKT